MIISRLPLLCTIAVCLLIPTVSSAGELPQPDERQLRAWFDEALEAVAKIPAEQRRAAFAEWTMSIPYRTLEREDRIKHALMTIALRPQHGHGASLLLMAMSTGRPKPKGNLPPRLNEGEIKADRDAAIEFLTELYTSRAGLDSREGMDWHTGWSETLLYLGRTDDAWSAAKQVVRQPEDATYSKVYLAVLEKVRGNDAPLAELAANCPAPPADNEGYENYCVSIARSIASRASVQLQDKTPPALHDILANRFEGAISWHQQMHGLARLIQHDPRKAEEELTRTLADKDAPAHIKDDVIYLLAETAVRNDQDARALSLFDCWLARRGVSFAPMTSERWQELTLREYVPTELERPSVEECLQHDFDPPKPLDYTSNCLRTTLTKRYIAASGSRNLAAERQTIEWAASLVLEHEQSQNVLHLLLQMYGISGTASKPIENTDTALQYRSTLPGAPGADFHADAQKRLRAQTARVTEPWSSPATAANPSPAGCP